MNAHFSVLLIICLSFAAIQFALICCFTFQATKQPVPVDQKINAISVLVPFRNEAKRIEKLILSINKQTINTALIELLFIDDYSTDLTAEKITIMLHYPHKIISNELNQSKKSALSTGIASASYPYILTLDADVSFEENYFESVLCCPQADLVILPIHMQSESLTQQLGAIEFKWMQKLTFGNPTPILCNGANLLFKKQSYQELLESRTDFTIASGDDIFLMQALQQAKKKIIRINNDQFCVSTPAPESLLELLRQRKRWAGKFKHIATLQSAIFILFISSMQAVFLISLYMVFVHLIFGVPILLKLISELIFSWDKQAKSYNKQLISICLHQFWYPVYLILLLFPFQQNKRWKKAT